jgi:hypothetical protein
VPNRWLANGPFYDEPIGELIAVVDGHSVDVDGSFQARVVFGEQVGDAAFAVLEEQGFCGTVSFTDLFTLAQVAVEDRQQDERPSLAPPSDR